MPSRLPRRGFRVVRRRGAGWILLPVLAAALTTPPILGAQNQGAHSVAEPHRAVDATSHGVRIAGGSANAPLTLEAVYARLDSASPMLGSLNYAADAAAARVGPAGALPDPRLELGTLNRDLRNGFTLMDFSGMNMVGLMQMVPLGGKLGAAGRAAAARRDAADAHVLGGRAGLRTEAAMVFFELYASDRALVVARETREVVREAARGADAMYRVGRSPQVDVLRAHAEVTRMSEEIIRMEAMRRRLVAQLGALLDLTFDPDSLRIVAPGIELELPGTDSLVRLALDHRPELLAGRSELTAAEAAVAQANREAWPDLELGVQYGWRPMDDGTDQMLSLVVGANLPIFAGRKQNRMKDEARAMAAMAGEEVRGLEAGTRGGIRAARERYTEAQRLRRVYRDELLPQARAALRAAASAYSVGEVDWMTWLDNQMTVNRYRQELYQLAAAQGYALAGLEELTGVTFTAAVSEEE